MTITDIAGLGFILALLLNRSFWRYIGKSFRPWPTALLGVLVLLWFTFYYPMASAKCGLAQYLSVHRDEGRTMADILEKRYAYSIKEGFTLQVRYMDKPDQYQYYKCSGFFISADRCAFWLQSSYCDANNREIYIHRFIPPMYRKE